jgi:hypothetical protein
MLTGAGHTIAEFNKWAVDTGFLTADVGTWSEVPEAVASRCLKGARGLVNQLKGVAK